MEQLSVPVLESRLKRAAWLPLGIIAGILLGAMAFTQKQQFDERLKNISFALSDIVESQRVLFAQEVLLGQPQATDLRVQTILENWRKKYPTVQGCISVRFLKPTVASQAIEGCSIAVDSVASVFNVSHPTEFEVNVGDERLASIRYVAVRPTTLHDLFPTALLLAICMALAAAIFAHHLLVRRVERTILSPLLQKISVEERNAAIAETTTMLAHDIRRPFQTIRMALRAILDSSNGEVRQIGEQDSPALEASIRSANAMLQDVIDVSREMKLEREPVSIRQLVGTVQDGMFRLHEEVSIATVRNLNNRKQVLADREKVARVLSNLLENAIQAVGARGQIRITAEDVKEKSGDFVCISIWNDGPVIPSENRERLFDPFFSRRKGGTGLGLSIARKIVSSHGGTISCSSAEETGTLFSFTLPASSQVEDLPVRDEASNTRRGNFADCQILVFDDEKIVHSVWRAYANAHDYHTLCHFSSWEEFVAQDAFPLVRDAVAFVDIQFLNSKYDGFDIARSLRQLGVRRLYAITSATEAATASGLFDGVYGKTVPAEFESLIA